SDRHTSWVVPFMRVVPRIFVPVGAEIFISSSKKGREYRGGKTAIIAKGSRRQNQVRLPSERHSRYSCRLSWKKRTDYRSASRNGEAAERRASKDGPIGK